MFVVHPPVLRVSEIREGGEGALLAVGPVPDGGILQRQEGVITVVPNLGCDGTEIAFLPVWNDAGTAFAALDVDVDDQASAAASLLARLSVGGAPRLTVSKAGTLSVFNDVSTPVILRRNQSGTQLGLLFRQPDSTDGNALEIGYRSDTTGAGATADQRFAEIRFLAHTHNHATRRGDVVVLTAGGGSPIERIRVTGAGNVGIGIADPASRLHVRDDAGVPIRSQRSTSSAAGAGLLLHNPNTTDANGLLLSWTTDTTGAGAASDVALASILGLFVTHDHATRTGALVFNTASGAGAAERMRITGSGNVVIGTSQPTTGAQPLTITQAGSASWVSVKLELATSQIGYGIYSSHASWTNPFSTAAADGYDDAVFDSKFISTITWWSPTSGGLALIGNSSATATPAINFSGNKGSASPIVAVFQFNGVKSDGSGGRSPLSGSEMLFRVRNDGSDVLTIRGNGGVSFTSPGPHSIGGSLDPLRQLVLHGTFAERQALRIATRVQPPAGISSHLLIVAGTIDKAGSGTHAIFAGAQIDAPTITAGAATVTDAITLRVSGAPTGGVNNYAFQVDAGVSRFGGTVGIGTPGAPAASALLDLSSTTGALLVPRMTTTQRNALTAVDGMVIYNTTTAKMQARAGGAWVDLH